MTNQKEVFPFLLLPDNRKPVMKADTSCYNFKYTRKYIILIFYFLLLNHEV